MFVPETITATVDPDKGVTLCEQREERERAERLWEERKRLEREQMKREQEERERAERERLEREREETKAKAVKDVEEAIRLTELSIVTQQWVKDGEEYRQASLRVANSNVLGGGSAGWRAKYASDQGDAMSAIETANNIAKNAVQYGAEAKQSAKKALSTLKQLDADLARTLAERFEAAQTIPQTYNAWRGMYTRWQTNKTELQSQQNWIRAYRNNDFARPQHEAKAALYSKAEAETRILAANLALQWSKAKQKAGRHVWYEGDEKDLEAIDAWATEEKARLEAWAIAAYKASELGKARQQQLERVAKEREEEKNRPYIPFFPAGRW